jgi:pilus assembly protein CpaB
MAVATLGALVVFASVLSYVGSVRAEVGELGTALRLSADVEAFAAVDDTVWEEVQLPTRWMSATTITDPRETIGLVAGTALPAGSYLQRGMLVEAPALEQGQREIAILIDAETGVAGKVRGGSVVDIYATFTGDPGLGLPSRSDIIVTNALVLQVGQPMPAEGQGFDAQESVPITFALSVQESLALTFAESFADNVRLAIVGGGDRTPLQPKDRTFDGGLATPGRPAARSTVAPTPAAGRRGAPVQTGPASASPTPRPPGAP